MPVVRLAGCRSDSLLGYLKALGILRVVATQIDSAARGAWDGATFSLDTSLPDDALDRFFLGSYSPTPVLNPWNSGAGFDGKSDTAENTLRRAAQTQNSRWESYRRALAFVARRYVDSGARSAFLERDDKYGFIRDLRSQCPDEMLPWVDAAVMLTSDRAAFPYLLGSGGNDGRLDFSVNFAARALDVCGDDPLAEATQLWRDSLHDSAGARLLKDAAIGQFSSRHAGGANATNGFGAGSLVNPWDYVLMIEGALLFSGAIARRTDRAPGRPVFPFALRSVAGGYGTASDDEQARGEVWLPVWNGWASLRSIADLLRKGRIDLPNDGERSMVRAAVLASEAATAVVTLGVPLGIRSLERITFVQRNGLAFSAAALGSIRVDERYDRGIAIISRNVSAWIERLRRLHVGASSREALRKVDDLLLGFSNVSAGDKAHARQELLVAIADLDRAVARTRSEAPPVPRLSAAAAEFLDDGSIVHRAALAVASHGAGSHGTDTYEQMRKTGDNPVQALRDLLETRVRDDLKNPAAGWLRAAYAISVDDAAAFLTFDHGERLRFNSLLRAYALIRLGGLSAEPRGRTGDPVPAAYAVLKVVFDNPKARDERILRLLFAGNASNVSSALALAVRRARTIGDLPFGPRDVSRVHVEDPAWIGCALALPLALSAPNYRKLLDAALVSRIGQEQNESVRVYLKTIE